MYNVLAENVFTEFSKKSLIKIINKNCDYFSKADKYEIWKMSMAHLLNDKKEKNSEYLYRIEIVKKKLNEFLLNTDTGSVGGFVNFRLKELEYDLEEGVEECVQDYLLEREYAEFINMLRFFISINPSKHLAVEVIYDDKVLIYADGKNITGQCIRDFNREVICTEANIDDFLLNSLISIAPQRIMIKQKNKVLNEEIKKTLLGIFGDKLKITTE